MSCRWRWIKPVRTENCRIRPESRFRGWPGFFCFGLAEVAYRTEKSDKYAHLPCSDVAGQCAMAHAISRAGFPAGRCSGTAGRTGVFCDGEGVEAQVFCWDDRLFYCQQRFAAGRERNLRGDPPASIRRGRLPVSHQEFQRSLRAGRQGKSARHLLRARDQEISRVFSA